MDIKFQNYIDETDYPISKEKMDNCYTPNGDLYPLCKGNADNETCKECNLYENY